MTTYRNYADMTKAEATLVAKALAKTGTMVASELRKRGRANTRTAGKFGAWAYSVTTVREGPRRIVRAKASVIAQALELGSTFRGKPLLWIPISSQADAQAANRVSRYPGVLVRGTSKRGNPLLIAPGGAPKFWGTPSLTMPKKLHLRDIGREISQRIPEIYSRNMQGS